MESDARRSHDSDDAATVAELLRHRPRPRRRTPKNGDLVWAKPKPKSSSWRPALITSLTNSSASISFFGRRLRRRLPTSETLPFEENYAKILPTVPTGSSNEITLAFNELAQKSASAMLCSCRTSSAKPIEAERRFEPTEMLGFVLDVAISAQIDEGSVAAAVRVSAQVVTYRRYTAACRSAGARAEFCPKRILGFVFSAAVSSCDGIDEMVRQIGAYRRFVQVHRYWVYRWDFGVEDGFLGDQSEGSDKEILSDYSPGSEKPYGVFRGAEDNFFVNMNEDNLELLQEQLQNGRENCVINREDFSILDCDEKYESLLVGESAAVFGHNSSVGVDNNMNETIVSEHSYSGNSSGKSDKAEYGNNSVSLVTDIAQRGGTGTEFYQSEGSTDPILCEESNQVQGMNAYFQTSDLDVQSENVVLNGLQENIACQVQEIIACHQASDPVLRSGNNIGHSRRDENTEYHQVCDHIIQSENDIVLKSISETTLIGEKKNLRVSFADECKINNSEALLVPFSDDCLQKTACCLRRQVLRSCGSECDLYSHNRMSAHDDKFPTHRDANLVVNRLDGNGSGIINTRFRLSATSKIHPKRRHDQSISSSSFKLQKTAPEREIIQHTGPLMEYSSSIGGKSLSNSETIVANDTAEKSPIVNAGNNIMKFHSDEQLSNVYYGNIGKIDCMRSRFSSKSSPHHQNSRCQYSVSSLWKWDDLYLSPLTKVVLKSRGEARKSLMSGTYVKLPKSLHMKFPKDFNLPSKEELAKKFGVFGPLDLARTKVFFYTGAGQVVFLNQYDADVAYKYAKRKNLFGPANVRFWLDAHENFRRGHKSRDLSAPIVGCSSLNLKSCLKSPNACKESNQKKTYRVRFLTQNQQIPLSSTNMLKNETSSLLFSS